MSDAVKDLLESLLQYFSDFDTSIAALSESVEKLKNEASIKREKIAKLYEEFQRLETETLPPIQTTQPSVLDEKIPHSLTENFTGTKPTAFIMYNRRYEVGSWKDLLVVACEILYNRNQRKFKNLVGASFNTRSTILAHTKDSLGKGKLIPGTKNIFIETNRSANDICKILLRILYELGEPSDKIKIYIRITTPHYAEEPAEILSAVKPSNNSEPKIGQYAKEFFVDYFNSMDGKISESELADFQNKAWCKNVFGIDYPLLRKYPIVKWEEYAGGSRVVEDTETAKRYYKFDIITINGNKYALCSQWFEYQRPKLEKWIAESKQKTDKEILYVTTKDNVRICQKCSRERHKLSALKVEYISAAYTVNGENINNKLCVYVCSDCKTKYILDSTYRTYIRGKDIDSISVEFKELK